MLCIFSYARAIFFLILLQFLLPISFLDSFLCNLRILLFNCMILFCCGNCIILPVFIVTKRDTPKSIPQLRLLLLKICLVTFLHKIEIKYLPVCFSFNSYRLYLASYLLMSTKSDPTYLRKTDTFVLNSDIVIDIIWFYKIVLDYIYFYGVDTC